MIETLKWKVIIPETLLEVSANWISKLNRSKQSLVNVLLVTVALTSVWCTGCGKDSPDTPNTVVVSNGVMTVDTREKIQFDAPDYNNYLQELNRAEEKGADSKFTLYVVDQDGKEVSEAEVDVLFPFNGRRGNTLSGKTDVHGLFSVEDKTTGEPSFVVMKKGYYVDIFTEIERPNNWGRNHPDYGSGWLHSDIINMAFFYNHKLFDSLVSKGGLK